VEAIEHVRQVGTGDSGAGISSRLRSSSAAIALVTFCEMLAASNV
jgi:hypothetical protein